MSRINNTLLDKVDELDKLVNQTVGILVATSPAEGRRVGDKVMTNCLFCAQEMVERMGEIHKDLWNKLREGDQL